MGREETSVVSIGVNIDLSDLINAINKDNYEAIRDSLLTNESLIEDENGTFNDTYYGIIDGYGIIDTREYTNLGELDHEEYKKYMIEMCDKKLYNQTLLVPHRSLLKTERRGYNREGTNGSSCELDIKKMNILVKEINDKMTKLNITEHTISLIVAQHTY